MINNSDEDSGTGRNQLVGNIGLYYVCYELSKKGWNAMTTSRNARGVDVVIYDQKGPKSHTIQVKSLSKRNPARFGSTLNSLIAEYVLILHGLEILPLAYLQYRDLAL